MKNKTIALAVVIINTFATGAMAGPALSPAFVQQATGHSASAGTLDTAAIFKPSLEIMAAVPRVDTSNLVGNLSFIYQSGDFNTASIDQTGSRNVGLISQIGYANSAAITQVGTGHQAFISQQGRNNVAIIRQR
jgi:minor curlin subunit